MVIFCALIVSSPRLVRRTTPVTPMMSPMSIIGSRARASSGVVSLWLKIWILPPGVMDVHEHAGVARGIDAAGDGDDVLRLGVRLQVLRISRPVRHWSSCGGNAPDRRRRSARAAASSFWARTSVASEERAAVSSVLLVVSCVASHVSLVQFFGPIEATARRPATATFRRWRTTERPRIAMRIEQRQRARRAGDGDEERCHDDLQLLAHAVGDGAQFRFDRLDIPFEDLFEVRLDRVEDLEQSLPAAT